jgi:phage baseplate assembly protein gpV
MAEAPYYRVAQHPVRRKWAVCRLGVGSEPVFLDDRWRLQEDAEAEAFMMEEARRKRMAEDFERLIFRLAELERRVRNIVRYGRVTEVDAASARVKVTDEEAGGGEGKSITTDWLPWTEIGGAFRTWTPPSIGQQVAVISPSGNLGQGLVLPNAFSDHFPPPSDKGDEHVMAVGETRITIKDSEIRFASPKIVFEGDTHLGGEGGEPVHRRGDKDSDGDAAVEHASKVWAV